MQKRVGQNLKIEIAGRNKKEENRLFRSIEVEPSTLAGSKITTREPLIDFSKTKPNFYQKPLLIGSPEATKMALLPLKESEQIMRLCSQNISPDNSRMHSFVGRGQRSRGYNLAVKANAQQKTKELNRLKHGEPPPTAGNVITGSIVGTSVISPANQGFSTVLSNATGGTKQKNLDEETRGSMLRTSYDKPYVRGSLFSHNTAIN